MNDLRTAAQQALEAWQTATYGHPSHHKATLLAMTALKAALAEPVQEPESPARRCGGPGCDMRCCQPVQEPVAWQWLDSAHFRKKIPVNATPSEWRPLYTAPPQRKDNSDE